MTPFLTAQVPYGTKGFTFLLGHLTYAHRKLTEEAMGTVQGSGQGADAKRIWFRGWVAQQDTGREGWATLVIANVAVNELDPKKLERLQWKLSQLNHSLADALASAGAQTAQAGNYLEAPRLREWEVELEVAQLPSAGAGPVDHDLLNTHSQTPKRARWRSAVVVIGLVLLSVFLWKTGSNPPNEPKPATAEDSQGSGPAKDTDKTMKIPQQNTSNGWTPGKRKPWKDLVNNWKAEDAKPSDKSNGIRAARAVDRIAAELKKRSEETMADSDQELLNDYLAESFCPQTVESQTESKGKTDVSEPDSLQPELKAIHNHFKMLKDVDFVKLSTIETCIGNTAFENAFNAGIKRLIKSRLVQNANVLCGGIAADTNRFESVKIALGPSMPLGAVTSDDTGKERSADAEMKAVIDKNRRKASEKWELPSEISQIEKIVANLAVKRTASDGQKKLVTATKDILNSLLEIPEINIQVTTVEFTDLGREQDSGFLRETSLLQLLHRDHLIADFGGEETYLLELAQKYLRPALVRNAPNRTTKFIRLGEDHNSDVLRLNPDPMSSGSKKWQELRIRLRESIAHAETALGLENPSTQQPPAINSGRP